MMMLGTPRFRNKSNGNFLPEGSFLLTFSPSRFEKKSSSFSSFFRRRNRKTRTAKTPRAASKYQTGSMPFSIISSSAPSKPSPPPVSLPIVSLTGGSSKVVEPSGLTVASPLILLILRIDWIKCTNN